MHRFANHTMVFRVDAAALDADGATVIGDLAFLVDQGVHPIVVAPTRDVARTYVRLMNRTANAAVGLSGRDGAMLPAGASEPIGAVQAGILRTLTAAGYVPVIEPTALGLAGDDVDVAADDVATAVAAATSALRAIFFHAAGGVVDPESLGLISELTAAEALALAERSEFDVDLRTAIRAAARGVRAGVAAAQIVDGRIAHAAVVEFLTAQHLGTQVTGGVYVAT
jgi:acetylglutamate kinase